MKNRRRTAYAVGAFISAFIGALVGALIEGSDFALADLSLHTLGGGIGGIAGVFCGLDGPDAAAGRKLARHIAGGIVLAVIGCVALAAPVWDIPVGYALLVNLICGMAAGVAVGLCSARLGR
ncbi:hypothetical protein [Spirillospora sp. CA-128828]|uniref:hypothetical protein n=1 Tax=Spirillospora sp. CA-128828 TaxID=3240033 RepID=UPI003D8D18B7